jgi:DNA polymerase III subunit delta
MALLTQAEFDQEIKKGVFRMVYFLHGPEEFLRRQALNLLRRSVLTGETFSFNYAEFSLRTASIMEVLGSAQTFPFGSPWRLVIAGDLEALPPDGQNDLAAYLDRPFHKAVLVLHAAELDRRTSFYKALREKTCVVEFPALKGAALQKWTAEYIRSRKLRMSAQSLRKLVELAGADLQSIAGEVEKLCLYAGEETSIPDSVVEELLLTSRQRGIFELTGAIGRKDRRAALMLLANLMESGEAPLSILAMIARHYRQLFVAKDLLEAGKPLGEIASAAQIPPFVLDEFVRQARTTDWQTARKTYTRLADIDNRIKSSRAEPRTILEEFICSL